jgi:hypothetical protein
MKTKITLTMTIGLLFLAAAFAVPAALAAPGPFNGAWESIDIDGSYQTMHIGGGPGDLHRFRYHDDGATVCGLDPVTGDILFAADAGGWLTASGDQLTGTLSLYCKTTPPSFNGDYNFVFTYDPGTDTLTDQTGVVWTRR